MNVDSPQHIPEGIEARISAMLLSELTASEEAEVRRAIERDPDLARMHERLKRAVELIREAVPPPAEIAVANQTLPQMSEERRQKLLLRFKTVAPKELSVPPRRDLSWAVPMSIAAVLMALLTLGGIVWWGGISGDQRQDAWLLSLSKQKSPGAAEIQVEHRSNLSIRDSYHLDSSPGKAAEAELHRRSMMDAKGKSARRFWDVDESKRIETATAVAPVSRAPEGQIYLPRPANANKPAEIGQEARLPAQSEKNVSEQWTAIAPDMIRRYGLPLNAPVAPEAKGKADDSRGLQTGSRTTPEIASLSSIPAAGPPLSDRTRPVTNGEINAGQFSFNTIEGLQEQMPGLEAANTRGGFGGGGGNPPVDGLGQAGKSYTLGLAITPPSTPAQQVDVFSVNGLAYLPTLDREQIANSLLSPKTLKQNEESVDLAKAPSSEAKKATLGEVEKDKLGKRPLVELEFRADPAASSTNGVATAGDGLKHAGREVAKEANAMADDRTLEDSIQPDAGRALNRKVSPEPQPEVSTPDNAFSTFSLNVTDVSFKLAAASLEKGALPEPATVRSEEFINAFNYRDPEPAPGVPVAFAWARAQYPYAHNRDLVRFAVQTAARGRAAARPLNLVLLLDNSGSMERADRVRIIREALVVLGRQLQAWDRISVVAFARSARLWVDALPGNQAGELVERVGNLPPDGGTNLEEALNLAYATAARHFLSDGVNRVVLLTDGAANLGDVDPDSLQQKVESWRRRGVALDCFGIGWEGYNDDLLEVLSRHGDGRYGFVNKPEDAATEFAAQLAGALRVAASDVKVQVEFNPRRVTAWRQLGYAKHQLTKEQFRDNSVDAAELAEAEAGNALYVIQVDPRGAGPIGVVRVRYREPDSGIYREHEWALPCAGPALPLDRAPASLRLGAVAAAFSEWLMSSPFAGEVTPDRLLNDLQGVPAAFEPDPRPQKLEWMIRQAKSISGK